MLEKIITAKKAEVKELEALLDIDNISIKKDNDVLNIFEANNDRMVSIIAEIKKASPAKGVLCRQFNPEELANIYEENGAEAISVITDKNFFQGSAQVLSRVKQITRLPILRKDFVIHEVQLYESLLLGADLVLLITAILDYREILYLCEKSLTMGLEPVVEIHTYSELKMALDLPVRILQVNNRNLHNFSVDINTSLSLSEFIPDTYFKVSASGIKNRHDLSLLEKNGFNAALIGETLVTADNPGKKLRELLYNRS